MHDVLFRRLALIGVGLIGSSLARLCRARGDVAAEVVATARTASTREKVLELGLVDKVFDSIAETVAGADCVILCTPVGSFGQIASVVGPALAPGAILTDVGSTKQSVIRDVAPFVPERAHFVPGHPIAGTEHSGPEAGFAELFKGRYAILTPPPGTNETAIEKISELWRRAGSIVEIMEPAHHDRIMAIVSHLPHLIAFTICGTADDLEHQSMKDVLRFAASGFRDFTRIAASDPIMWRDIFLNNREALLEMTQRFVEDMTAMARAVRWGEAEYIVDKIERGRRIRNNLIALKQV